MFEEAIIHILKNEGGYVDHKADPGGATNHGVSLRFLKTIGKNGDINSDGIINKKDIKVMKVGDAKKIYLKHWWNNYRYGRIKDSSIATKVLDMSINIGPYHSHCILQKSANDAGAKLLVDGILGYKTIRYINSYKYKNKMNTYIIVNLSKYYLNLYSNDKKNRVHFILGWLKRAIKK